MKAHKILFWIVIALLVFGTTACGGSGPSAAVKGFYSAVEKEDFEKAMEYFSSNTINSYGLNKLQQVLVYQLEELRNYGGIKNIDIIDETVVQDTALVKVRITMEDGSTTEDSVNLIKEDGDWKTAISNLEEEGLEKTIENLASIIGINLN